MGVVLSPSFYTMASLWKDNRTQLWVACFTDKVKRLILAPLSHAMPVIEARMDIYARFDRFTA